MGMRKTTSRITLPAAIAMIGLAALPIDITNAVRADSVIVSTRLFLGRINNWMIWEYKGNEGRFCFITSSPEGTSPLRQPSPELWVTQRPLLEDGAAKGHVFEVSVTAEEFAGREGGARLQMKVGRQKRVMAIIGDRFWLQSEPDAVEELLKVMLDLEADYQKKKRRDPRSEPEIPMIDVRSPGKKPSIAAQFSVLGLTKAKSAIEERCMRGAGRA
jgi:hypothetical protein